MWGRIKARLEKPQAGAGTLTVTLRDFLIVTYAVPEARVREHVPAFLPLDTLPNADGERVAFVQSTCFFNDDMRWSKAPEGSGLSFYQSTYRVLTRREGRRGAYFLRTYLGTGPSHTAQRAIAREADFARFFVHVAGDPARASYDAYTVRVVGERGQTNLDVRAAAPDAPLPVPFGSFADMAHFLTQREEGYYAASAPKNATGLLPVEHAPMTPVRAELAAPAKLTLWTDLGILKPDELAEPLAVLIQPSVVFTAFPPRLTGAETK